MTSTQTTNAAGQVLTPTGRPFDTTSLVQKSMTNLAASAQAIVARQKAQNGPGGLPVPSAAVPGAVVTPADAQARAAQSIQDLNTALTAIQNQLAVQSAFHTAALAGPNNLGADPNHPGQTLPNVSNGLGAGALAPAAGVASDPTLWQNAKAPTQATKNGKTTVTIDQTKQKAVLTWDSFNVGKNTTVYFDQAAGTAKNGTNNWIALNRIVDPSDVPSQILGSIKAEGTVYLLNQNGIIFGGSSQVNTHSLIATSLNFLGDTSTNQMVPGSMAYDAAVQASNAFFLANGLVAGSAPTQFDDTPAISAGLKAGGVSLKAGATITTGDVGFALLAAPSIVNAGSVIAPGGTALLIADDQAYITLGTFGPGIYTATGLAGAANVVTNTGLVQATTGNVTLVGNAVAQAGVVEATTSITRPGSIDITAEGIPDPNAVASGIAGPYAIGPLTLKTGSLTALLPDDNGQTTSSSAASTAQFNGGSISLKAGLVTLQNASLIYAPGQSVSISIDPPHLDTNSLVVFPSPVTSDGVYGRIYLDHGSDIDVAGLPDVQLPITINQLTIGPLSANELADAPLQRNGALFSHNLTIDTRISGVNAETGQAWIGSPLIDAQGNVQAIPRKIDQLLLNGGNIALTGGEILTATGSVLDFSGGFIHYLGGTVTTSRLLGASGNIYSPSNANPLDPIVGFAGQSAVDHPRWGVTEVYTNAILAGRGDYESDYLQGGNAGSLTITTLVNNINSIAVPNPAQAFYGAVILNGTMLGEAFAGRYQVANGTLPTGGAFTLQPLKGNYNVNFNNQSVIIAEAGPELTALDANFHADTVLATPAQLAKFAADPNNATLDPTNLLYNTTLSAQQLSAAGLSQITLSGVALVESNASLSVQPGGTSAQPSDAINLVAPVYHGVVPRSLPLTVLGQFSAPSGSINLSSSQAGGSIEIGPKAVLSTRGQWVNDTNALADQRSGAAFINGGSITIDTSLSADLYAPTPSIRAAGSPSILLDPGSLLDVSSGGYVQPNGQIKLKNGIPVGIGGSITLSSYNGNYDTTSNAVPALPTSLPTTGGVSLEGTLLGYGFAGGGKLTLQTLGFLTSPGYPSGSIPINTPAQDLLLPWNFFSDQGFGSYNLQAVFDATIGAGTPLQVSQRNFIPNYATLTSAPTGSNLYGTGTAVPDGSLVTLGRLDPYHRQPTGLSVSAGAYQGWTASIDQSGNAVAPVYQGVTGTALIDQGASIQADAGAAITITSAHQVTVLGTISAPGGSIALGAVTTLPINTPENSVVWLGPDSRLDVSGTILINPFAKPAATGTGATTPVTGAVLPGGSVSLVTEVGNGAGYIIAAPGAVIDVSGASGSFDLPQPGSAGAVSSVTYAATPVWSDAGQITFATGSLLFDGQLIGHGGAAQAQGGTLTLAAGTYPYTTGIILQQSGLFAPPTLRPADDIPTALGAPAASMQFAVDRLTGSGISTLILGDNPAAQTSARRQFSDSGGDVCCYTPLTIAFAGNVNLSLGQALFTDATNFVALAAGSTGIPTLGAGVSTIGGTKVSIAAPYVELGSSFLQYFYTNVGTAAYVSNFVPIPALADGTLAVNAKTIDLVGQFELAHFANVRFAASSDIRLYNPPAFDQAVEALNVDHDFKAQSSAQPMIPGVLYTAGNLSFQGNRIYPGTADSFIIDAVGPVDGSGKPIATNVSFGGNGASNVPLSAGGAIVVDATTIVQGGTLRAPSGAITLGVNDSSAFANIFSNLPVVLTQSVTLAPGSLTSVSLDGAIVPYGSTSDGTDYKYQIAGQIPGYTALDLLAPPAKVIALDGVKVALNPGAVVDLAGGGDLQAQEWVPGTGGSRNVLLQTNLDYSSGQTPTPTPLFADNRPVYAIIPGYAGNAAPNDPAIDQPQPGLAIGQSVTLTASPGLPAGTYTLLPAEYATLPGAYRLVQNTGVSDALAGQNHVLADGTMIVAGSLSNGLYGTSAARSTSFEVQSRNVWQQYSEYTLTGASQYFPVLAANAGVATPRLPVDAGRLTIGALAGLTLGATVDPNAAAGGRAAEVDIASQDIEIVGAGESAGAGYLTLSADALDQLGAASLLIGGTRTDTATGQAITVLANSIVVANNAGHPLTGPEITLATKTDPTSTDPNAATGLLVESGSVIAAQGAVPAGAGSPILIGSSSTSGDGALLRVSNGKMVTVTRSNLPATPTGLLTIQDGATITGGQALILNAADVELSAGAAFSGHAIDAEAKRITFVTAGGAASGGLTISPAGLVQFLNASQVSLRSAGAIDFQGDITVALNTGSLTLSAGAFTTSTGSDVTLKAPTLILTNTLGAAPGSWSGPSNGALTIDAGELDFGTGDTASNVAPVTTAFYGFGAVKASASQGIAVQGTGGIFDFGSIPVTLAAPIILADTGAGQTLKTTGLFTLDALAGKPLSRVALGGSVTLQGGSIADGIAISAPAGRATLEATGGDLNLGGAASIDTQGAALAFYDQVEYVPGGSIDLNSVSGNITVPASVTLNYAGSSKGGDAGSLSVSAPSGIATLLGTIQGQAQPGFAGGSFSLSTGGVVDLDNISHELQSSGGSNAIRIQSGAGNLTLSAGNSLVAGQIALFANGGSAGAADTANGNILINGTLNANGLFGGLIELYGKSGIDVEGSLLAAGSDPQLLGGTIVLATSGATDGSYNAAYGYENVPRASSGKVAIGANAVLDVSGGSAATLASQGKIGGTILLRAPVLADGGVAVTVANAGAFKGSRATTLEAYAVWSTTDATGGAGQPTAAQHFDGVIDPSGWYDASGNLLSGTFYGPDGTTVLLNYVAGSLTAAQLKPYLTADYFTPSTSNAVHQTFYGYQNGDETAAVPGTLMGFVQNPITVTAGLSSVANLQVAPGIELDNPNASVNNGSIQILTPWNLGALDSIGNPVFRLNGVAPYLSLRAAGDVVARASVTDGFKQNINPLPGYVNAPPGPPYYMFGNFSNYDGALAAYSAELSSIQSGANEGDGYTIFGTNPAFPGVPQITDNNGHPIPFDPTWTLAMPDAPGALGIKGNTGTGGILGETTYDRYYYNYLLYVGGGGNGTPGQGYGYDGFAGDLEQIAYQAANQSYPGYDKVNGVTFQNAVNPIQPGNLSLYSPVPYLANYSLYSNYIDDYTMWATGYSQVTSNSVGSNGINYTGPGGVGPQGGVGYGAYYQYITQYGNPNRTIATLPTPPQPPLAVSVPLGSAPYVPGVPTTSYITYNGPAPVSTPNDPLPLLTANLTAEPSSTSYRIVAGADFSSTDPLAVRPAAIFAANAPGALAGRGSILIDGHNAFVDSENGTLLAGWEVDQPTMIRTGTGSISLAAGADIQLLDVAAPAVIYAAGTPAPLIPANTGSCLTYTCLSYIYDSGGSNQIGYTINTGTVQPFGAGDVMLAAGQDIIGKAALNPLWSPWTNSSSNVSVPVGTNSIGSGVTVTTSTAINFGTFDQGVMSIGGNVTVRAGGSIVDLSVSSPTTYDLSAPDPVTGAATIITTDNVQNFIYFDSGNRTTPDNVTAVTLGGGNVTVTAAGDILSGSYWAAKGNETLSAGGQIANSAASNGVSTVLGITAGELSVSALGKVDVAEVYSPALSAIDSLTLTVSHQTLYSPSTAVQLRSISDSVTLDSAVTGGNQALPPVLDVTALAGGAIIDGGFVLQPSPQNSLNIIANGTVQFAQNIGQYSLAYGAAISVAGANIDSIDSTQIDPAAPPARIYSLTGDIIDGTFAVGGTGSISGGPIGIGRPAQIYAGHDIVNLTFFGQNYYPSDVTRIIAGHDLYDTQPLEGYVPSLQLGGPGTFDIEAGRNIGPLTNIIQAQAANNTCTTCSPSPTGIFTVGNLFDPVLPKTGANITVLFGVGPGVATASFADRYLDPSNSAPVIPDFSTELVSYIQQYQTDQLLQASGILPSVSSGVSSPTATALSPSAAFAVFQTLPVFRQQLFEEQALYQILNQTGLDYNNPASPYSHQYARGYQAVNTLFPASDGYTQNNLSGGSNGAASPVTTGILDMRSSTIQTQQGGDISILGPGGELLVGSTGAPPNLSPNLTGILTLEQGNISIFEDRSVLLAQSRIFTEQGGDVLIWSSNGDINAGEGVKTSFVLPPAAFVCDFDDFCTPNVLGEVSGAGIGVLQTIPNAPSGNADLIAPRGTVDAGAAGIRVSGNLNIAALQVLNAFNVQVGGRSVGVPTPVHIDTAALSAASSVVTATEAATSITHGNSNSLDTIISVEVVGFGEPDEEQRKKLRRH